MRFLRTTSTKRLLASIAGLLIAAAGGSAIAIAAGGSGPVPAPKPLASAIHAALAAPAVEGITARVTFTNRLISSSDIQGIDPLLTGGSGRLWLSPTQGLRVELQSANGDAQIVVRNNSFWAYDPTSNTVYEGTIPAGLLGGGAPDKGTAQDQLPSIARIQSALQRVAGHASVSSAIPGDIAGRPTYTVRVSPLGNSGLVGGAELAWDALRGVPLNFAIFAKGDSQPVLALTATDISYGRVSSGVFNMTPPPGAHVVTISLPATGAAGDKGAKQNRDAKHSHAEITGASAVASHLSFGLDAPARLASMARSSVKLLGRGKDAGALVAYGQGLGGVYVIERPASGAKSQGLPGPSSNGADQRGLSLPSVSVNGAPAQELSTPLGTVLQFTRHGVSYTVLGSVTKATAELAARSL